MEDVVAAQALTDYLRQAGAAVGGGDISRHELVSLGEMIWPRLCRGKHGRSCVPQRGNDCCTDPLSPAGDERPFAL